jgi:hypothetical protein
MARRSNYVEWDEDKLDLLMSAVDRGEPIKRLSRFVGISNDRCVVRIRELGLKEEYRENRERRRGGKTRILSPQTENWEKLRF